MSEVDQKEMKGAGRPQERNRIATSEEQRTSHRGPSRAAAEGYPLEQKRGSQRGGATGKQAQRPGQSPWKRKTKGRPQDLNVLSKILPKRDHKE